MKTISLGAVLCSSLYGTPNIPANCTTPGSCAELTPALKKVTLKESVALADADASHTATIKAAANTTENVVITLPPVNGQPNQILATDVNGSLIWKSEPSSADRLLGLIGFMVPDNARGIYALNGQTINDAKLAAYIIAHPITGFDVSGTNVKLPDWRGRYLGATGAKGISATSGQVLADATATNGLSIQNAGSHKHNIHYTNGGQGPGYLPTAQDAIGYQFNSQRYVGGREDMDNAGTHAHSISGDSLTRPETVGMPMVIIGESK
jgi:hypothetical protein